MNPKSAVEFHRTSPSTSEFGPNVNHAKYEHGTAAGVQPGDFTETAWRCMNVARRFIAGWRTDARIPSRRDGRERRRGRERDGFVPATSGGAARRDFFLCVRYTALTQGLR